jgi:glycosyltransferase involved in cell wall biosynthesis
MITTKAILFLIPHLGGGGAERVTAHFAAGLSESRFRVDLGVVTELSLGADALPAHVTVHRLGASRIRTAAWPILRLVWRLRPDLIFSNMFHLNFLVLLLRPLFPRRTRCLIRQNGMTAPDTGTGTFARILYRTLYPRADGVVCQSDVMATEMRDLLGTARNLHVLPNPVSTERESSEEASGNLWRGRGPRLLAIGRLTRQKGFDMLLPAFQQILQAFPEAELAILGQGPEETDLKAMCRNLGIEARVCFAGYVLKPQAWFAGASAFVLSSRHEGISNALLEAAAAGLPIVSTPALGGIAELLKCAPGSWLARTISAEALAVSLLAALDSLRDGQRFSHPWLNTFRMENALPRFERLIDEVLAGTPA